MKITKQKLKEIIKEELTSLSTRELTSLVAPGLGKDMRFTTVEGSREQMTMPALSQADMETAMGADIEGYPEPEEEEDPMASRLGTREEQLLSRILTRAVVDKYDSLQAIADDLDIEMTKDMARFIGSLKANPMYGSSGLEEASDTKVSKKRKEKTLPDSKKNANKAYNKASRAQAKRNLKK